ncbi:MAG: hypothetical protein IJZ79_03170 [Bacilli bacterium]|nr:hypothetical protein [Bacilli bacterium]MBQ8218728.1 hypothetical protein [Bacilli bacterium]
MYLYHATDRKNLESILEKGLLVHPPEHNWDNMYCDGQIFLAFDASVAEDYADASENAPEEIVILKVKLDNLNSNNIGYDWNNRCEYTEDINSCIYKSDISANCLQVCNSTNEPSQNIHSFKGTDLYEIILNTFDEEVETNLERED